MSRNPNRCWITQTGDDLFHREKRVVAKADAERMMSTRPDYGETWCGKKLHGDRKRMNDLPMHQTWQVCRPCQQGYVSDAFPALAFAR